MLLFCTNINDFFSDKLKNVSTDPIIQSYIVSVLVKYKKNDLNYSKESLTILYSEAKNTANFHRFQSLGDFIFFCNTLYPEHLNNASPDYYHSIGRLSYYSCYRLMNKEWKVFENMADELITLSLKTRKIIQNI